jgi:hypothetical protein
MGVLTASPSNRAMAEAPVEYLARHSACGRFGMGTDRDLYARITNDVIDYYGYTYLVCILNVNVRDLDRWAEGRARPPTHVFLRIIDLANAEVTER